MEVFHVLSLLLVISAILSWVNHRYVGLPTTIGVMVIALVISLALQLASLFGLSVEASIVRILEEVDFSHTLLDVLLAFLLFAGALHVNIGDLASQKWIIGGLATIGVLVSTLLVAGMTLLVGNVLGLELPFLHCLLFGSLIAPTDPIAVMGILKQANAPKSLETKIAGESLFNDGVGVVIFSVLLAIAVGSGGHGGEMDAASIATLAAKEILGSAVIGLSCGYVAYRLMKSVDNYHVEVLITLALCVGVYSMAASVHSSGPLAVVMAGLLIGNTGRRYAMTPKVIEHVDTFWELVDEILNVLLFVLVGMEVLIIPFQGNYILAGLISIPLVLLARLVSVGGAVKLLARWRTFSPHAVKIMTWGGLRGGISVALALMIPETIASRDVILTMTYIVVVFSIGVQGMTIGRLLKLIPKTSEDA
ncbi:MAG: CPA1 family monovalent cation:H+ antiporter [Planctomycetota bacterium]|jgi:CPA1 family monovalent cation:H+ antiporter